MTLKIISSDAVAFNGEVTSVTLPGSMGSFTVLNNHASLIATLSSGTISYTPAEDESSPRQIDIDGGIVDVDNNVVSVCLY